MLSMAHYIVGNFFIIMSALDTIAHAYEATLAWDANDEPDLAGYIVYINEIGSGSQYYQLDTVSLDENEPDNPMYTATELEENLHYCFVLTAYNMEGFESGFSNKVCVLNGQQEPINHSQDSRNDVINFSQGTGGGGGGGCFISISNDEPNLPLF